MLKKGIVMPPSISVILPVFNADPADLRKSIESILNQTYSDFEFIIINDGSTNNSEEVILSYDDKRIKYVKNDTNLKLITTLNKGLKLASGEYIARIDSDDYCDITRFEKQIEYMNRHPETGLLGTGIMILPNNTKAIPPADSNDIKLLLRYCINVIAHPSVMIRKSVLVNNNLEYNSHCIHAEDYKLWCDMSRVCEIGSLQDILLFYKNNPNGISRTNAKWQRKISTIIKLDNMINDFAIDKDYMYTILSKYVKNIPMTEEEANELSKLLTTVIKYVTENVSEQYKEYAVRCISLMF